MTPQNKNLIVRIASAIVLLPVVLYLVWLGNLPFALMIALASALCAREMTAIALKDAPLSLAVLTVIAAGLLPLAFYLPSEPISGSAALSGILVLVTGIWILNLLIPGKDLSAVPARAGLSFMIIIYSGGLLTSLLMLRMYESGIWWVVLVLAITFLNDTGGYFAGRFAGKKKLYPRVSPAKTWEGFFGGITAAALGAIGTVLLSESITLQGAEPLPISFAHALLLGLFGGIVASAGDLSESLLKRAFSIKDSGNLIPGHGGIFDRIDALLFAGPAVWLYTLLFI